MTLPGLKIQESVAPLFSTGDGGKTIAVIGTTGTNKEKGELCTFHNFHSAYNTYYSQDETKKEGDVYNPLLQAVYDIFQEAEARDSMHNLGINTIHTINTGENPENKDYTDILKVLAKERNIGIEAYIKLSDVAILNSVKTHLDLLAGQGEYRIAIATTPKDAEIKDMKKMTTEDSKICSSRVVLHSNPDMLAAFTAKVACTPYFEDPSRGGYRSKNLQEVKIHSRNEIEDLLESGIVADWDSYDSMGRHILEPCMAISTSHTPPEDNRPADCVLHHRLNADHQARVTDKHLRGFLKSNNNDIMRQSAELKCKEYLSNEVRKGCLEKYEFNLTVDENNPSILLVNMKITPVTAIQHITINRNVEMPTGRTEKV